jgi:hypothetical protein
MIHIPNFINIYCEVFPSNVNRSLYPVKLSLAQSCKTDMRMFRLRFVRPLVSSYVERDLYTRNSRETNSKVSSVTVLVLNSPSYLWAQAGFWHVTELLNN